MELYARCFPALNSFIQSTLDFSSKAKNQGTSSFTHSAHPRSLENSIKNMKMLWFTPKTRVAAAPLTIRSRKHRCQKDVKSPLLLPRANSTLGFAHAINHRSWFLKHLPLESHGVLLPVWASHLLSVSSFSKAAAKINQAHFLSSKATNEMTFGDFFVCWLVCSWAQTTFLIPFEGLEEKTNIPCKGRELDKAIGTQHPILCPNWAVFTSGCLKCRPSLMRRWEYLFP